MKACYRIYTETDIDRLVDFWNQNAGWDIIDRTEWERRFYHTPLGPTAIVLAEDEKSGELLGHFIFVPSLIVIKGIQKKAFRPFAPVADKELRSALGLITLFELIYKMYQFGARHLASDGASVIHMLPDPRWQRAFQFIAGVQVGSFPLWSLQMPFETNFSLPPDYLVEKIESTDKRIDLLWEKTTNLYECSIVRDTSILPWKLSHGDYHLSGISHNGKLVALSASIYKAKDKQWLICDLLAEDEEKMKWVLELTCQNAALYKQALSHEAKQDFKKIAILATPMIEPIILSLGFAKDNYKFPVVIHLLDKTIDRKDVKPEKWYVSAND